MNKLVTFSIIFTAVGIIFGLTYYYFRHISPIFPCTAEIKICPNGIKVNRIPPKCDFSDCPILDPQKLGLLDGNLTIGPFCPREQPDVPCLATPETYALYKILIYGGKEKNDLVTQIDLDENGYFAGYLEPGDYILKINRPDNGAVRGAPKEIRLEAGQNLRSDIDIDTGIR